MLRHPFAVAAAVCVTFCAAALPAAAASVYALLGGDAAFNEICAAGNAAGSGNAACEFAVSEMRGGNNALSGDFELGMQNPPKNPISYSDEANYVWNSGVEHRFSLLFVPGTLGTLSLTVGVDPQSSVSANDLDLTGMQSLFIRTRQPGNGTVTLSGMMLDGHEIGGLTPTGSGSDGAGYLQISGIDWTQRWELTGTVAFGWTGDTIPGRSNLNVGFKLTDVPPIPLPAAAWLLLSGIAGLGLLARRRPAA